MKTVRYFVKSLRYFVKTAGGTIRPLPVKIYDFCHETLDKIPARNFPRTKSSQTECKRVRVVGIPGG